MATFHDSKGISETPLAVGTHGALYRTAPAQIPFVSFAGRLEQWWGPRHRHGICVSLPCKPIRSSEEGRCAGPETEESATCKTYPAATSIGCDELKPEIEEPPNAEQNTAARNLFASLFVSSHSSSTNQETYRDRYRLLLLSFICTRCGRLSLDPDGWDEPRRPLCEKCATEDEHPDDAGKREAENLRLEYAKKGFSREAVR